MFAVVVFHMNKYDHFQVRMADDINLAQGIDLDSTNHSHKHLLAMLFVCFSGKMASSSERVEHCPF